MLVRVFVGRLALDPAAEAFLQALAAADAVEALRADGPAERQVMIQQDRAAVGEPVPAVEVPRRGRDVLDLRDVDLVGRPRCLPPGPMDRLLELRLIPAVEIIRW
jgi:hypothetical protein